MNDQELVKELAQQICLDRVVAIDGVIWYGSREPEGDIDLCVVFDGPVAIQNFTLGRLDLVTLNRKDFDFYLSNFDPIAIEPILTGSIVVERTSYLSERKMRLLDIRSSPQIVSYLLRRSTEEYLNAKIFFDQSRQATNQHVFLLRALVNISFAWAYHSLANYYNTNLGCQAIALKNIAQSAADPQIGKVLKMTKQAKRGLTIPSTGEVGQWLEAFEALLLRK